MLANPNTSALSNKAIGYFLLCWTLLNALQAYTLELHGDEAYYWMYSRFLDWGYFDHPPMVAIFIRIGDSLMHNELGLRLLTVITNSASLYLIWLILKRYAVDAKWFILVASGLFIFHIYGFTTTPDSPLFFFTALFYFFYQKYAEKDEAYLALILALVIACLLYSKYHGVLLVGFTLCSNTKLLIRKSFWLIVPIAAILFAPHVLWQISHDYPSLKYHLIERSANQYDFSFTYLYPLGQIAIAGPLIGWFLFYSAFKIKISDVFIRGLVVNCAGTFLFFLLNSFKGEVQPHWTLIAFVPLLMQVLIRFKQVGQTPQWFYGLSIANIALILFVRMALMFHFPLVMQIGQFKSYFGFRTWAADIHKRIGDHYLVITDGFQDPSKYNYYTNSTRAISYDSRYYRKTQYDLWPMENNMQHQGVFYMSEGKDTFTTDSVSELYGRKWYTCWIDDFRTFQKMDIEPGIAKLNGKAGKRVKIDLLIKNPYSEMISFADTLHKHPPVLFACFFKGEDVVYEVEAGADIRQLNIKAHHQQHYTFNLTLPAQPGNYDMIFSIRTTPFVGSRNSGVVKTEVD